MSHPIWKGQLSFGLVTIPVVLYSAESRADVHFKLVDSRNLGRIRYERINEETGKEVPWEDVAKAYEYDKGNYVLIKEEELSNLKEKNLQIITIEDFIDKKDIDCIYFEKPYYLIPDKKGEKGYVLLRETLRTTNTIGIAKLPIRTKQYLAALMPCQNALLINILRYQHELRKLNEFDLPQDDITTYKITPKEMEIAKQLVNSMKTKWDPSRYHDEYMEALEQWLEEKAQAAQGKTKKKGRKTAISGSSNVIDFMTLLKKSLSEKKTRNIKKSVAKKTKGKNSK